MSLRLTLLALMAFSILSSLISGVAYYALLNDNLRQNLWYAERSQTQHLQTQLQQYVEQLLHPAQILATHPQIQAALRQPDLHTLSSAQSLLTESCNLLVQQRACYVLNAQGERVLSSVDSEPHIPYVEHPYFRSAMNAQITVLPAWGLSYPEREMYLAIPIRYNSTALGVFVVQMRLQPLKHFFVSESEGQMILLSPAQRVFLSTEPDWELRLLNRYLAQSDPDAQRLQQSGMSLPPMELTAKSQKHLCDPEGQCYLRYQLQDVAYLPGWSLLFLQPVNSLQSMLLLHEIAYDFLPILLPGLLLLVIGSVWLYLLGSRALKQRRKAEQEADAKRLRLKQWNRSFAQLAKGKLASGKNLLPALQAITRMTGQNLQSSQVGIWLYQPEDYLEQLICQTLYILEEDRHIQQGIPNLRWTHPEQIAHFLRHYGSISSQRCEFTDPAYRATQHIQSSLSVPIHLEGEVVGLLCCLQTEQSRSWYSDEKHYVSSMADWVGMNLQAEKRHKAEAALRHSEIRLKEAQQLAGLGNWEWDLETGSMHWSEQLYVMLGLHPQQTAPSIEALLSHIPPAQRGMVEQHIQETLHSRNAYQLEHQVLCTGGKLRTWYSQGKLLLDEKRRPQRLLGTCQDITQRKQSESEMAKLSSAVTQAADAILITDQDGLVEYVNPAFENMTGYSLKEIYGQRPNVLKSDRHDQDFYRRLWETILADRVFRDVLINRKKDGSLYYEEKTINPLKDEHGKITHFIATSKDITERMLTQQRLSYLAHHDVVTELPNRAFFIERLEHALKLARSRHTALAVLFLDLDRFKNINDTLGHSMGDLLLQQLGQRLRTCVAEEDTLARLGGDEFTLLLENTHEVRVTQTVNQILQVMTQPFHLDEHEVFVTTSIGVGYYPQHGSDVHELLKHADAAMYCAKQRGRNTWQVYAADMTQTSLERLNLETELRYALERNEFVLHYQPQLQLSNDHVHAVEALLRWQSSSRGLISPDVFIPVLEETGMIASVGRWVLYTACAQAQHWRQSGYALQMAVNISSVQFRADDFITYLAQVLAETGLPAEYLELEITESVIMENAAETITRLQALSDMGVRLAIDDFGTGYSSLSYLKRFPIHTLKIDRSFVNDIAKDRDDAAIVKTIVDMGHNMKLTVVAEGVETVEQLSFLRDCDCDSMQGYWLSRPLNADDFMSFLQTEDNHL